VVGSAVANLTTGIFDIVTSLLGQGAHTLSLVASDATGHSTATTVGLTVDNRRSDQWRAAADRLVGDSLANTLDGGAGADQMIGGAGNDTYVVENAGDVIVELAGGGTDTARTSLATYSLAAAPTSRTSPSRYREFHRHRQHPRQHDHRRIGQRHARRRRGIDHLVGGLGNDTYLVDNAADVVTEGANAGTDTVLATAASYNPLSQRGKSHVCRTGTLRNRQWPGQRAHGCSGSDTLSGLGGNDTLVGGGGNDTLTGGPATTPSCSARARQ